jgi:hypothetical protein
MTAVRIIGIVFAVVLILVAFGLLFAGATLVWADQARKDSEGFIGTDTIQFTRDSHAIVTVPIDLEEEAVDLLNWVDVNTVRLEGRSDDPSKQIFMGIASDSDVTGYLEGVNHDEMSLSARWLSFEPSYENRPGDAVPGDPTVEGFWAESIHGAGTQRLDWEPEAGSYSIVLMNDDGSAGIDLSVVLKAEVNTAIFWIGVAFLVGGSVLVAAGILLVYLSTRK